MVRKCRKASPKDGSHGIGVSSTYMQLRSRRIVYVGVNSRSENSVAVAVAAVDNNGVASSSSCCASNEYIKNSGFIDLEEERDGDTETSTYRRRTKRKLFENLREKESMENSSPDCFDSPAAKETTADCCCSGRRASSTTEEKKAKSTEEEQPTEAETEDFFVEAEKKLKDTFNKKYNFDFEKEKPLEGGRYEWVKLAE